jgi:O-methyltransferase domain
LLETLRRDAAGSLRGLAMATTLPAQWLAWNQFTASVRTGRTQVEAALGTDFFGYLGQHPSQAREFSAGMASTTSLWAAEAAKMIDTTGVSLAVDVGGANGSLLHLLQDADPDLRGIVFDRPNIVGEAVAETVRKGLAERTEVIAGDFFESVPSADLYLMKFILHDWDDEGCLEILQRCRQAMAPGGRIAVIEIIVGELSDPGPGALMDMNILAVVPGQERSLAEYDALLTAAGLRRTAIRVTRSPQSIIEAVAA